MAIKLPSEAGNELPNEKWSVPIRFEVAQIRAHRAVLADSVRVRVEGEDSIAILFTFRTAQVAESQCTDILPREDFGLIYASNEVGRTAPSVLSDRDDFPRYLPHLNLTEEDRPASLCLSRVGLQPFYERGGVTAVLERLADWLRHAKTGELTKQGWEPVPTLAEIYPGAFDTRSFQEEGLAMAREGMRATIGVAALRQITSTKTFSLTWTPPQDRTLHQALRDMNTNEGADSTTEDYIRAWAIPWLFMVPKNDLVLSEPIFSSVRYAEDIERILDILGLKDNFRSVTFKLLEDRCFMPAGDGTRYLVVIIGVWRPIALLPSIYGLSDNIEARKLEIKAYAIEWDSSGLYFDVTSVAREITTMTFPDAGMLRHVSGTSATGGVALIGYGALGSIIGDHLLRCGIPEMSVVDPDFIASHNLARHTATQTDIFYNKALHAEQCRDRLYSSSNHTTILSHPKKIEDLDTGEIVSAFAKKRLIVDASANERVRQFLSFGTELPVDIIMRVEIFHKGRLGVQSVTDTANNPDLNYLYTYLCFLGLIDNDISTWLNSDAEPDTSLDELLIGFSCASATSIMPKDVVSLHAASFMPMIRRLAQGVRVVSGLGVNPTSLEGQPTGFRWYNVAPYRELSPTKAPEWKVRIRPEAIENMDGLRLQKAPVETGGYLYGTRSVTDQVINVIISTSEPTGTIATETKLKLGESGTTDEEEAIYERCGKRIYLVGTWHSHPANGPSMSAKDKRTIAEFREIDRMNGVPTLLAITSTTGIGVHLFVD